MLYYACAYATLVCLPNAQTRQHASPCPGQLRSTHGPCSGPPNLSWSRVAEYSLVPHPMNRRSGRGPRCDHRSRRNSPSAILQQPGE